MSSLTQSHQVILWHSLCLIPSTSQIHVIQRLTQSLSSLYVQTISGINGEGEVRGQPANQVHLEKWQLKRCVCMCLLLVTIVYQPPYIDRMHTSTNFPYFSQLFLCLKRRLFANSYVKLHYFVHKFSLTASQGSICSFCVQMSAEEDRF